MARIVLLLSAIGAAYAHGETGYATWNSLCDAVELTFNGDAEKYGSSGRLVKLAKNEEQSGSMFFSSKLDMTAGGELEFTFNIDAPADGLAIVLQSETRYALGEKASGMGFYGLKNGVAIEIDGVYNEQWGDPEPSDDDLAWHVEVHHSPSTDEPDYLTPATKVCDAHGCTTNWLRSLIVDLSDGEDHVVTVQFPDTSSNDTTDYYIKFAIDGGTASYPSGDWIMFGPLDDDWFTELDFANMYIGITAGTGGDEADVFIKSMSLQVPLDNTECFTGFEGDDCAPTVPDNACEAYEHCGACTADTFCCGWDDSEDTCAAVSDPDAANTNLVVDMCPGYVDPYAETTEDNDDSSALDILGVLVAVLAVAVMAVNYFGRQRVIGTLRGSYGPLAEDARASLTETL